MNPKEKMACDARTKRKIELRAEQDELRVADEAVIAMEEKRKLDAAKQRFETVFVEIIGPDGHVGRCTIPIAVVVQLGLFNILLGLKGQKLLTVLDGPAVNDVNVSNIQNKSPPQPGTLTDPPHEYIPPIGASVNTWPNIIKIKENIDFCSGEFNLMNRIHCSIRKIDSGPQLS